MDINSNGGVSDESVLEYLLSIPELVELDGLQRDKFQTLPHQVTPLPLMIFNNKIIMKTAVIFQYH